MRGAILTQLFGSTVMFTLVGVRSYWGGLSLLLPSLCRYYFFGSESEAAAPCDIWVPRAAAPAYNTFLR